MVLPFLLISVINLDDPYGRRLACDLEIGSRITFALDDPECLFERQEVVLTVPASFDEAARELTVEAAKRAGYPKLTLLEEPQAAFYCWIVTHQDVWQREVRGAHAGPGYTGIDRVELGKGRRRLVEESDSFADKQLVEGLGGTAHLVRDDDDTAAVE